MILLNVCITNIICVCKNLEPKWPSFLKVNPSKQGIFQSKQGSFRFNVHIYICSWANFCYQTTEVTHLLVVQWGNLTKMPETSTFSNNSNLPRMIRPLFHWDYYNPENERQEPQVCVGLPKGISSSRGLCSDSKPFVFRFCLGLWEYRHELVPVKNGIFAVEGVGFVAPIFSDRGEGKSIVSHKSPIQLTKTSKVRTAKKHMSPKVGGEFKNINPKSRKELNMMVLSSFLFGDVTRKKVLRAFSKSM